MLSGAVWGIRRLGAAVFVLQRARAGRLMGRGVGEA